MCNNVNHFSLREEIWHSVMHGIGFLLSIAALVLLVTFAALDHGSALSITAASIYGTTLIVMYGSSTLYHSISYENIKILF